MCCLIRVVALRPLFRRSIIVFCIVLGVVSLINRKVLFSLYYICIVFLRGILVLITWLSGMCKPQQAKSSSWIILSFFILFWVSTSNIEPVTNFLTNYNLYEYGIIKVIVILRLVYLLFVSRKMINNSKTFRNL